MRYRSVLRMAAAVLGLMIVQAGEASAGCVHGYAWCTVCGGYPTALGTPTAAMAPAAWYAPTAYPGYSASAMMAPAPPRPSFLDGYSEKAPILAAPAGTRLFNGQLFASHIYDVLRQFFTNQQNQQDLLNLATSAFFNATGFMPTTTEREILEKIVLRFLGDVRNSSRPQTTPTPTTPTTSTPTTTTTPVSVTTSDGNVVRLVVTIELPPGAKVVNVQQPKGESTQPPTTTPAPTPEPTPITPVPPEDVSGPPPPPCMAPAAQLPPVPSSDPPGSFK